MFFNFCNDISSVAPEFTYKKCTCRTLQLNKLKYSIGAILKGSEFNKLYEDCTFVKLTNSNECHNGYKYKTGNNILKEEFNDQHCSNGLYFTEFVYLRDWEYYSNKQMQYVRIVTIPPNATIIIEGHNKYKCNNFILSDRMSLVQIQNNMTLFDNKYVAKCNKCNITNNNAILQQIKANYRIIYSIPPDQLTQEMCEVASSVYPPTVIHVRDEFKSDNMKKRYTEYCKSLSYRKFY